MDWNKIINAVGVAIIFILIVAIVAGVVTYYCWNFLMPDLFGFKEITVVQAIVLNLLTGMLFTRTIRANND